MSTTNYNFFTMKGHMMSTNKMSSKVRENVKITIIINKNPYHFVESILTPDDFRNAVGASQDYEVWQIVKSPDPEGELPVDDVQVTGEIEIKSGLRFRVVPPGTFGAQR